MRVWGFDIGTTSIGFAVIEYDAARGIGRIERLGVRIFPEGVTEDKKEPRNKTRRTKRLMRRSLRRRKLRRRLLNETLAAVGLLPRFGTPEWDRAMAIDPYELRRDGLSRALQPFELGRSLYHLAKRRGFAGRRIEEESKDDPDEAAAKEDAARLAAEKGERTLGAFLAEQSKKRGRHHTREMIAEELERLWAAQKGHHPILNDPKFEARIRHLVFYQRPTFWRLSTLSKCQFCPGEPLEPKGSWLGQEFLLLEQLTKLRLAGANARPLSDAERDLLREHLHRRKSATWDAVRKVLREHWLARGEPEDQRFNLEVSGAEKGLRGNAVEVELRKIFGKTWEGHPKRDEIRRDLHTYLWNADYLQIGNARVEIRSDDDARVQRRKARDEMQRRWSLSDKEAEALAALNLPPEWLAWSHTAVVEMLPLMERGHGVGELTGSPEWESWRARTFPNRTQPTRKAADRLPSHPRAMPELRNPTVHRALNELRKVVNNLLRLYGRPDVIRVELTRELKESKKARSERLSRNKRRESERRMAIADLETHGIVNPSREDVDKWLLWKESNERCPYTGDHIGFDALFREGTYQIEHIWPRSRSLDNTFANKTLCHRDINIRKGNRTPYEVWGSDPDAWHALRQRLAACKLPEHKVRRFLKDMIAEAGTEEFADRQLADTGWAARAARDFLKRLWPGDDRQPPVETVNGRITAQLRRQWGLDSVLNPDGDGKTRGDHRHHAIDALAAALTTRAFVKRLSDWYQARDTGLRPPQFERPWPSLLDDARSKVEHIVVSHKPRRKASGPLHAETVMGDTGQDETSRDGLYRLFVTRKPVERLSKSEIGTIRDPAVRELVEKHVAERGGDPKKAFPPYPRLPASNGREGPEVRRVRLLTKQQLNLMVPVGTGYADAANNHHMAVYRSPEGGTLYSVVSLHEVARRISARQPIVSKVGPHGGTFLMSICAGDTLEFPQASGPSRYRVVQSVWSNGQVVLLDHTDASKESKNQPGIASIIRAGARKVVVDPIGRVRPARD